LSSAGYAAGGYAGPDDPTTVISSGMPSGSVGGYQPEYGTGYAMGGAQQAQDLPADATNVGGIFDEPGPQGAGYGVPPGGGLTDGESGR
jgi:hypothetical protein